MAHTLDRVVGAGEGGVIDTSELESARGIELFDFFGRGRLCMRVLTLGIDRRWIISSPFILMVG